MEINIKEQGVQFFRFIILIFAYKIKFMNIISIIFYANLKEKETLSLSLFQPNRTFINSPNEYKYKFKTLFITRPLYAHTYK